MYIHKHIHMSASDIHKLIGVHQGAWTSAEQTSVTKQYAWPSGEKVIFGLKSATALDGHQHLEISTRFKLIDNPGSVRSGFFCEARMYTNILLIYRITQSSFQIIRVESFIGPVESLFGTLLTYTVRYDLDRISSMVQLRILKDNMYYP